MSVALALLIFAAGCSSSDSDISADSESASVSEKTSEEPGIYINGTWIDLTEEGGSIDLDLLSVEDGITVSAVKEGEEEISVNGEEYTDSVKLDVSAITRDETIDIEITDDTGTADYTINLMPSTFPDYTTEGESQTAGDYYLTTYDEEVNYIFKLDNQGNLIFYKETGENALDFRKQYNSDGEVRYTYLQYLESSFCGIGGINPGCVVIMDENYDVIEEVYYQTSDGEEIMIDPHGFIYIDDGHYILAAYKDIVVEEIPEDQVFSRQHSIIVTDDGSYMSFNNANEEVEAGKTEVSSIIKLKVDEETMTVTEYSKTDTEFFSNYMGAIRELDSENGIYLYSAGGNYTGGIPEYSMIEYSETEGYLFTFRFNEGNRRLYCANKCE